MLMHDFCPVVAVQIVQPGNARLPVYNYCWTDKILPQIGNLVLVPLGKRNRLYLGVILWSNKLDLNHAIAAHVKNFQVYARNIDQIVVNINLKHVHTHLTSWKLCISLMSFAKKISDYNLIPLGQVFKLMIPFMYIWRPAHVPAKWKITNLNLNTHNLTQKQKLIWEYLQKQKIASTRELSNHCAVTHGVMNRMCKQGLLARVNLNLLDNRHDLSSGKNNVIDGGHDINLQNNSVTNVPCATLVSLSKSQQQSYDMIKKYIDTKPLKAQVLQGLPGAGKTEVYTKLIQQYLQQNKQVLLLLPEIMLTKIFYQKLCVYFGNCVYLWHGKVNKGNKKIIWQAANRGDCMLVIGTRSSLFIPFCKLALIVVDEEQDSSYKQEDGSCCYHARDAAIWRGFLQNIPVLLVSATPAIETMYNVLQNKYNHVNLNTRFFQARLPQVSLIDMGTENMSWNHWISNTLAQKMHSCLQKQNQILLFLNRRGYAPVILCRHCKFRFCCHRCSSWLVMHKTESDIMKLQCHYCHFSLLLKSCPKCQGESFNLYGPGVDKIHEEIKFKFPQARTMVVSSDKIRREDDMQKVVQDISNQKCDIIIGTQILAKGYNFPHLTLVGLIDADLGLQGGELRALEQNFQLIFQVAGRSGRMQKPGQVWVQTFYPRADIMQCISALDQASFYRTEIANRQRTNMPPFTRLILVTFMSLHETELHLTVHRALLSQPRISGLDIWGPHVPYVAKIKNIYRQQFLWRVNKNINIQNHLRIWLNDLNLNHSVFCKINVDPYNILS